MELLKRSIIRLLNGMVSKYEAEALLELPQEKLDDYLDENEWESFVPGMIPEEWSARWYRDIHKPLPPPIQRLQRKHWLSAAAIILLAMSGIYYNNQRKAIAEIKQVADQTAPVILKEQCVSNQNATVQDHILPDGSLVKLSPASAIRYTNPMETNKRSVWLEGEAIFHVKKDADRPFTVFSSGLATTAVGTVFKVSGFRNKKPV